MNKNELCIVTMTWARNADEEILLREALQQLATFHIQVFITDGGSGDSFIEFIKSIPHFCLLTSPRKGVQAQIGESLLAASKTTKPFILYTEPDKKDFFNTGLSDFITQIHPDKDTGIIMASRTAAGFSTFPLFQQMTETAINNCSAEATGYKFDYTYGPFLLNKRIVPYLLKIKADIGWGWRPYAFIMAKRLGLSIDEIKGSFFCPSDQQSDDSTERLYRMKQLEQNIRGVILSTEATLAE